MHFFAGTPRPPSGKLEPLPTTFPARVSTFDRCVSTVPAPASSFDPGMSTFPTLAATDEQP